MRKDDLTVTEVARGVHRYGTNYINCYLIEDRGRLTLLDSGLPGYVRHLRGALASLNRSVTDIDTVLLTHCHVDHMGAAKQLQLESGGRVYIHAADAPVARGERKQPLPKLGAKLARSFLLRYVFLHLLPYGAARFPTIADTMTFEDGETLDAPGSPRVVHTPGHTSGSSSIVLDERSTLFSGDALVTLDTLSGRRGPHVFAPPFTDDHAQAIASLDVLEKVEADITLPGHGEPWKGTVPEAVAIARSKVRP
jgi:glyoxylase-like metal-dependent hydrolase (beta-lactamase superfamily II)